MSPRHLADVHLPSQLAAMLSAARLPGAALTVEVTEDSIMSDPERAGEVLRRIRDLGIAVSIDDFGTGYSSLAYLRDLAATEVKIDKTFVLNAASSKRDLAIVKAAADLGHGLGLQVVAEGIEDDRTGRLMAASGCDLLQGYLILPPVPAAELLAWHLAPRDWLGGQVVRLPEVGPGSRPTAPHRPVWRPNGDHPVGLPRAVGGVRRAARKQAVTAGPQALAAHLAGVARPGCPGGGDLGPAGPARPERGCAPGHLRARCGIRRREPPLGRDIGDRCRGLLNLVAIAANGGVMPATRDALEASGWEPTPGHFANSALVAGPHVQFLGDVFATPSWLPVHSVFSVGDVVIVAGFALFLHETCWVGRAARPAQPVTTESSSPVA